MPTAHESIRTTEVLRQLAQLLEREAPSGHALNVTYWVLLAVAAGFMVNARSFRPNIFFLLMALAIVVDIHRLWKRRA